MTQYDAFEARLLDIGFGGVFRHCSLLFGLRQRRSARDGEWTDRELLTMRYHVRLKPGVSGNDMKAVSGL